MNTTRQPSQKRVASRLWKSLPPQEEVTDNPENPRRFRVVPKWTIVRPHSRARAMEGNPVRHKMGCLR